MNKVQCVLCQALILQSTYANNYGLCGVCKRDIKHLANMEEISRFEEAWPVFLDSTRMPNTNDEGTKQRVITFVEKYVDKNLKAQLLKPDLDTGFFFLQFTEGYPNRLIGQYDRTHGNDPYELVRSSLLPNDWHCPIITFSCKLKQIPPIPQIAAPFLIFSQTVVQMIADLTGSTVQYLPVLVEAKDGSTDDYLAVNLLNRHDIWDLEISTWQGAQWAESSPFYMRNMMAKINLAIDDHLFRNKQYNSLIVVSKQLGELLLSASGQSISLQHIDKWHN